MKVRNGFVSNSSSSSFCLFGVCKSSDDWEELLNAMDNESSEDDTETRINSLLKDSFLYYAYGIESYSEYDIIIGSEPELHKDKFKDKTFIEYEEIVLAEFKRVFGDNEYSLAFYTDGGYNG